MWPSAQFEGMRPLLEAYLAEEERAPDRACLALAGPVEDGFARLTNLGWDVDAAEAAEIAGVPSLRLVNDFVAAGYGILQLDDNQAAEIQSARPKPGAPIAILGAGTGLGVAHVDCAAKPAWVVSSEGGHADFAPRDDVEWGLAQFLAERYGRVSRERVLSGSGLIDTYHYLASIDRADASPPISTEPEPQLTAATIASQGFREK